MATLLKDERFVKDKRKAMTAEQLRKMPWVPPMFRTLERNMLDLDPPDHTRLRTLVHKAFTPSLVARMRDRVQSLADELLTQVMHKGECDLIRDYALPLPMTIITEILGVPTSDRNKFHKWSKAVVSLSSPSPTLARSPERLDVSQVFATIFRDAPARSAERSGYRANCGGRSRG